MRFLLFALVVLLSLSSVWCVSPEWKSCATPTYDVTITNITANEWPPAKGSDLVLNITGTNTKNITSGDYIIQLKVDGIPLPNIDGDIDTFKPLPWPVGNLSFTYSQEIPESAPSGTYTIHISAVDQDKKGIFCITLEVKITGKAEGEGALSAFLHRKGRVMKGLEMGKGKLKALPAMPKMKRRM